VQIIPVRYPQVNYIFIFFIKKSSIWQGHFWVSY